MNNETDKQYYLDRKFVCDKCNKRFYRKQDCKRHEYNHLPNRFSCDYCKTTVL
jgi:uncharacterized Zn-finger protein